MEITITLKDEENDIDLQKTTCAGFESAEENLWSLERNYKRELGRIAREKEEEADEAAEEIREGSDSLEEIEEKVNNIKPEE